MLRPRDVFNRNAALGREAIRGFGLDVAAGVNRTGEERIDAGCRVRDCQNLGSIDVTTAIVP